MVLLFLEWFQKLGWKVPAALFYCSTRMALAVVTSLLISILLGPAFIRKLYAFKIGQPIRKGECPALAELHAAKEHTPTMGGVLILFSMLVSLLLWMKLTSAFTLILGVTTIYMGVIGALDDYLKLRRGTSRGLSGRRKLLAQAIFGLLLASYLLSPVLAEAVHHGAWFAPPTAQMEGTTYPLHGYITQLFLPFFKHPICVFGGVALVFFVIFLICVVAGTSNAVNLTDGLDGLAVGSLILVASSLALVAFVSNHIEIAGYLHILYIEGSGELAIYLAALVGAGIGFLWYNGHPAQVFMGDTGSLSLGGVIGVSAILLARELLLVIIGGIFVIEALSVIIQVASFRWRGQRRVFLCAPLHHHFECKGWPETKVVIRFWIVGLLLAIIGLASLKFQ